MTPPSVRPAPLEGAAKQAIELGRNRLLVAGALFTLGFAVVGFRLADVTIIKPAGEPPIAQTGPQPAFGPGRAVIVDRNGVLVATSLDAASLYADPRRVLDPGAAARKLAAALPDLNPTEVRRKLASKRSFVWIKRHLTPRQQYAVNSRGIPGLYFQREERRVYPHGRLLAHVLGFAGTDGTGLAGIEKSLDDSLRAGSEPVRLSVDVRIQHVLRRELARAVQEFRASGAAGVVIDVASGELLAIVSLPDFDPNWPGRQRPKAAFNRATLGVYEMGSTFKIFNTAMALDSGATSMRGGYDATKPIRIARFRISDFHAKKRWLSVPEIFMYSSNIGSVKMALDVGTKRQQDYLGRLGLTAPITLEVPETGVPLVPSPWRQINTMTIAFGHGIAVTPVHMAQAVAAVVNGGIMRPATLLKTIKGEAPRGRRVLSARTSQQMRRLLRLVVAGGTGRKGAAPGYLVGGKTGTAEKIGGQGYRRKALVSSFVGAFPITAPRYVVLALVDEPHGNSRTQGYATGGWVAAPVVGRVIARAAPILGIAPQDEQSEKVRRALNVRIPRPAGGRRGRDLAAF